MLLQGQINGGKIGAQIINVCIQMYNPDDYPVTVICYAGKLLSALLQRDVVVFYNSDTIGQCSNAQLNQKSVPGPYIYLKPFTLMLKLKVILFHYKDRMAFRGRDTPENVIMVQLYRTVEMHLCMVLSCSCLGPIHSPYSI